MRRAYGPARLLLATMLAGCVAQSAPGPAVIRSQPPPWPAPRDGAAQIAAAGLEPSRLDDTSNQRRFTLTITVDGRPVPLAPYIGMDRPRAVQGPAHTHDDSGVVWLEGRGADTVTLGQFFVLWGVRFDDRCLGASCGRMEARADGRLLARPAALRLAEVADRLSLSVAGE